jgi:hypothetical protein
MFKKYQWLIFIILLASAELLSVEGVTEHSGIYNIPDFMAWVRQRGFDTYTQFLIRSPVWVIQSLTQDVNGLFGENIQPYYRTRNFRQPGWLNSLGNILHLRSSLTIAIDLILMGALIFLAFIWRNRRLIAWASLAAWLVLGGLLLLVTGYLGEVRSIVRHAMVGVVPLHLFIWLLLAVLSDVILIKKNSVVETGFAM